MAQTDLKIRCATISDYSQLCQLWEQIDNMHIQERSDVFQEPTGQRRDQKHIETLTSAPDSTLLVAENTSENGLVGTITLRIINTPDFPILRPRQYIAIDEIIVHQASQKKGVGRLLMKAAVDWGQSKDIRDMELSVYSFNKAAISFYEKNGFTIETHRMRLKS